jgi:PTS system nitrogen regulatory IIA component
MEQLRETTLREKIEDLSLDFRLACVVPLASENSKRDVFFRLVATLADAGEIPHSSVDPLVDVLLMKDRLGSCAWGNGLAFPHLRSTWVDHPVSVLGTAPGGLALGSLDGCPTRLVVLLLSPRDQPEMHAEILGQLAAWLYDPTLPYWLQASRSSRELLVRLDMGEQ